MNAQVITLIADAVTDAVKERIPAMIRAQLDLYTLDTLAPRAVELEKKIDEVELALADRVLRFSDFDTRLTALGADITSLDDDLRENVATGIAAAVAALPPPTPGTKGDTGARGGDGRDGRDATFRAPEPWLTEHRFERGAVVQHHGALWFAERMTDAEPGSAMSGYSLIVDGIHALAVTPDEQGYLRLVIRYASEREDIVPLGYRPPQDAGVFDQVRVYEQNDLVSHGGSGWWARQRVQGVKPGTDEGARFWRLAIKCGKDGRDGRDGRDGKDVIRAPRPKTNGREVVTP